MSYIYVITNDVNGKQYVGKTDWTIEKRFKEHIKDKTKRSFEKRPLYDAMNKYGIEHFSIKQLEQCNDFIVNEREIYWINKLDTYKNGYNATLGGDGKILYDYQEIVNKYLELKNQKETAKYFNCDVNTIKRACDVYHIQCLPVGQTTKEKFGKKVQMLDKNTFKVLKTFISLGDAGRFLTFDKIERTKLSTVTAHISEAARGKRKTAYGYKWKFIDKE